MNLLSKCVALALTTALAVPAALADAHDVAVADGRLTVERLESFRRMEKAFS